ncbi:MAG: amino acid ABC transporter permease [Clostridiales bacterium]|nr:amino acid ABC transporter permease [Clostridiales bacterium]
MDWFTAFCDKFKFVFVENDRYKLILQGLGNTLEITFFAALIGIAIGVVIASIRSTYDKNIEIMRKRKGFGFIFLTILDLIARIYLTVIRGTPTVVQLLIAYFIIFESATNGVPIAIFAFGINSGAYVAEILRGGIMSISNGQFEASRSLGFNYLQTMRYVIVPQVFKNVLPALCNEFIVLIKETSVAGYVGVHDLTKAGDLIRGRTFEAMFPLIGVACIYLVLVVILTSLVGKLERRLRTNER